MLNNEEHLIKIENVTQKDIINDRKGCISAIGHGSLARKVKSYVNRMDIQLETGDICYLVYNDNQTRSKNWYPTNEENNNTVYQKLTVLE